MVRITAMDQLEGEEVVVRAPAASGGVRRAGEPERLAQCPCPRCESTDTKFCYYNNYNLSQPRHFCKGCRRYWTRGGALRNVPVGGGTRKPNGSPAGVRRKRPSHSHSHHAAAVNSSQAAPAVPLSVSAPAPLPLPLLPPPQPQPQQYELTFLPPSLSAVDPDRRLLDLGGSFSSLLAPPAPLLPNFATSFMFGGAGAGMAMAHAHVPALPQPAPVVSQALPEGFWGMGWPDLSI